MVDANAACWFARSVPILQENRDLDAPGWQLHRVSSGVLQRECDRVRDAPLHGIPGVVHHPLPARHATDDLCVGVRGLHDGDVQARRDARADPEL